jgi:hypothetical protein
MPVRFSWRTWFRYSSFSWTLVKRGLTSLMKTVTRTNVTGSNASITVARLGLVANIMPKLPRNIRGARVNILSPMETTIWIMLRSLVSLVRSCPVLRSSRLPKLKVWIFLNITSRRSASKPRDAFTEK